jgi:hypothetical protein
MAQEITPGPHQKDVPPFPSSIAHPTLISPKPSGFLDVPLLLAGGDELLTS